MSVNVAVTGPPGSGKTTVVRSAVDRLEDAGYTVGGLYAPERRVEGERVGFDLVDAMTGETWVLARVDRETGPEVGNYRVNVSDLEAAVERAFAVARDADVVVIDEIATMEEQAPTFGEAVEGALDGPQPVLAAVQSRDTGLPGAVKRRPDVDVYEVTTETRDALPATVADRLIGGLTDRH